MLRRAFLGILLVAALPFQAAFAIEQDTAHAHVTGAIDEIVAILSERHEPAVLADKLHALMERKIALNAVSRFVVGPTWRQMSDDQHERFTGAFSRSVARSYARQFSGLTVDEALAREAVSVLGTRDAGRKGVLVETVIAVPNQAPIRMDYLVSDRGGSVAIIDVLIEGVSLAVTQRDIIGGMLSERGGSVDRLIEDLDDF